MKQLAAECTVHLHRSIPVQYAWVVALINVSTECGQKETAQQAMHQLLVGWPEESNTWRQAVWFNQQQGDFARAAAAMEIACRLQSNGKPDKEKLVSLYQMAGAPTEAGKIFADSLSDPKNPKSYWRWSWLRHTARASTCYT